MGGALGSADGAADRRVEIALAGVRAPIDGRWQAAKGATIRVRRLAAQGAEPTRGAVLARRDSGILGAAEDLAARLPQVIREAGWERISIGAMLGDGAPWIGKVADAPFPGVRQTLDYDHLREHRHAFATCQSPNNPAGAKAWVEQKRGALLADRGGAVLGALKRMRPWQQPGRDALAQLLGSVERTQARISDQEPWHRGRAVGLGAVEGAGKPVI
jgi:hypothetical protein